MEKQEIKKTSKVLRGIVVSDKMDKTIVVAITEKKRHPIYGKFITSTKKYKPHDDKNDPHVGHTVDIIENRHISKDKYFRLLSVVERAK